MTTRSLFVTKVYEADLSEKVSLETLAHSIRTLAQDDQAGRRWSRECGYTGYTSYASLNDLPKRDPAFADLTRLVKPHVARFAKECAFALERPLRLDSLWVNQLPLKGHHRAHIHPHSVVSGTFYVEIPKGSGGICFEDPRLPALMAAPPRENGAPEGLRTIVSLEPRAGLLLLWESWLRHEVLAGSGRGDRLSVSFNFA
ncbi:TIGR02466 family protein [Sphingomonas hankyongi]|uniref:TIGR02466 family protein n=1 Tax=Sphingomonas hankyongi TaxID=2908209 RepID=A0ABT0RXZ1_9SPHN|nr:TIGR02466 family protein [Sphingomonas hankyongi]MCL6728470.1 TIGR02466 family protein [Sphingomonas hankyongi]